MSKVIDYKELADWGIKYTRVHLRRLIRAEKFPKPIQLSDNRIAWDEKAIEKWLASRPPANSVA